MRIVSLVPAGTDIVTELGLAQQLVGVSHECDLPEGIANVSRLTHSRVTTSRCGSSAEIHAAVVEGTAAGAPMHAVDLERLAALEPDLIVTQRLCDVCAMPAGAIEPALPEVAPGAALVSLDGRNLSGMLEAIEAIGACAGRVHAARTVVDALRARLARVASTVANREPVPVICLEWLDPPYASGHWIPEMVAHAGGIELLGRPGRASTAVTWDDVARLRPPRVIALPCGFDLPRTVSELEGVARSVEWQRAIGTATVYAAAGGAYFTRPGPGLITGVELLASLLHPDVVDWPVPPGAVMRWS